MQHDPAACALTRGVGQRRGGEQRLGVGMQRAGIERPDIRDLDDLAKIHHRHPVGNLPHIRLGHGRDPAVYDAPPADFAFGRAIRLREGRDLTIIATGTEIYPALGAAEKLEAKGISTRVVDMHTISPLDRDEITAAAAETGAILSVEEHNITGGLGSAVAEVLVECDRLPFARHGVPDEFAPIGPPAALYAHYQLDSDGIADRAMKLLNAG